MHNLYRSEFLLNMLSSNWNKNTYTECGRYLYENSIIIVFVVHFQKNILFSVHCTRLYRITKVSLHFQLCWKSICEIMKSICLFSLSTFYSRWRHSINCLSFYVDYWRKKIVIFCNNLFCRFDDTFLSMNLSKCVIWYSKNRFAYQIHIVNYHLSKKLNVVIKIFRNTIDSWFI